MIKPAIMAVDDDPAVLGAVQRDLRREYGKDYRILAAASGAEALGALAQLKLRDQPVALILADQRMPQMTGVEFLAQAVVHTPGAKKVLLTAYADTEAAIRAINDIRLDHYLMKPWHPPEERLYPVLSDLLGDWQANHLPAFEGVRVVGARWSPQAHLLREFLARNQVPYRWLDVESSPEAIDLLRLAQLMPEGDRSSSPRGSRDAAGEPSRDRDGGGCRHGRADTVGADTVGADTPGQMPGPAPKSMPADVPAVPEGGTPDPAQLPVVLLADGTALVRPTIADLAKRIGLRVQATAPFYDLIIVGGGPSGLAAGVYGASEGLKTLIIEREAPGGQAGQSSRIENYLGFPVGLSGADLARRAVSQAARFGAEILTPQEVTGVNLDHQYKVVRLAIGAEVRSHALLVATGVQYRRLEAPGIEPLTGAGVYYGAALSEALMTRGGDVYVIGGGNSAGQAAVYLANHARCVTVLVRGAALSESMSHYLIDQLTATPNIVVQSRSTVLGGARNDEPGSADHRQHNDRRPRDRTGGWVVHLHRGGPRTEWLDGLVARDKAGFILTGPDLLAGGKRSESPALAGWPLGRDPYWLEASMPGIFAAGDVRARSVKRVASAVGEGSMAVAVRAPIPGGPVKWTPNYSAVYHCLPA